MKKIFLLCLVVFACLNSFSQTKKIAHKSHSGSNQEFKIDGDDNFGLPPSPRPDTSRKNAKKIITKVDTTRQKLVTKSKHRKQNKTLSVAKN